jgi:eukaryotic-like serine/threonine-protein kinase
LTPRGGGRLPEPMRVGIAIGGLVCLAGCGGSGLSPGAPAGAGPASDPAPQPAAPADEAVETAEPAPDEAEPQGEVGAISESGWATFHGNAARTGAVEAPAIGRPKIRWKAKVGIQSWLNGPLALGSLAVVPSSGNTHNSADAADGVYALDLKSGRKAWHARMGGDANGVAAAAGRVLASSDDGHVYAFDVKSGKLIWKQRGEGKQYSHPLLAGGGVIVGDAGGNLRAHALEDGAVRWSVKLDGALRGGAAADDRQIYAVAQSGEAVALDAKTGRDRWRVRVDRPSWDGRGKMEPIEAYSTPIVTDDLVIVPFARDTYYDDVPGLLALDKKNGRVRWRAKGPGQWGNVRSTPVLVSGSLIWGEPYSGDVAAISANTGRMLYRQTIGPCYFPQWASPAAAGDVVYLPRFDGSLYALSAKNGRAMWDLYLGDSTRAGAARAPAPPSRHGCDWDVPNGHPLYSPVAVAEDGTLLVGSGEGFVYAIENA